MRAFLFTAGAGLAVGRTICAAGVATGEDGAVSRAASGAAAAATANKKAFNMASPDLRRRAEHLVGGADDFGIHLISPLGFDQFGDLLNDID